MWKYVLKRIGLALVTAFIILSLSFILVKAQPYSKPGGTADTQYAHYLREVRLGYVIDLPEKSDNYGKMLFNYTSKSDNVTHYFYETPILTQYFRWLKNILTEWNWGYSTKVLPGNSTSSIITMRLKVSIKINILSVLVSVPLGILLGIIAALKKNTLVDHTISTSVMIFISVPSIMLIIFLKEIFCYKLGWVQPYWRLYSDGDARRYILPVICLSFGSICGYARFTRAELCEVMESDYLLLARTKGLTKRQAIIRHALRNAMVPIVPSIIAEFLGVLGGSMILEEMFGIPGIGSLYLEAFNGADYNVLFADMAFFTVIGLLAGVLLDISYGFIDPRIRMGAKK